MARTSKNAPHRPKASTVLLVEQNVLVRMVLAAFLRSCRIKVLEAGTAEEAITVLASKVPTDLVFSAHEAPEGADGLAVAQWARAHMPQLPVVLAAGSPRKIAKLGAVCEQLGTLPQPYDPAEIERTIRRLIATAGST